MKLSPLNGVYANYQVHAHKHSFTKPNPDRLYIKILKFINDNGPYVPSAVIRKEFPTALLYPHMLESVHYLDHYSDGHYTYWKLTEKGEDLLTKAYCKK